MTTWYLPRVTPVRAHRLSQTPWPDWVDALRETGELRVNPVEGYFLSDPERGLTWAGDDSYLLQDQAGSLSVLTPELFEEQYEVYHEGL